MTPYREPVPMCKSRGTYKYFFARQAVADVWDRLARAYGPVRRCEQMKTIEIGTDKWLFRSTCLGNPITVIRRRGCTDEDVSTFHDLVGFSERP